MDKWYYYKEAVRQFINHTAERWMQTQLKQKGLEQYFLAKIDDMQKTIVRFVLDPNDDNYNYQVIYMSLYIDIYLAAPLPCFGAQL